ncbi:MAG TPA: terminase family protein [Armatimonadota bacterium]|nr:terminase family protein [Armatimonadota bacterium]
MSEDEPSEKTAHPSEIREDSSKEIEDPSEWITKHCSIMRPGKGLELLKPYPYQIDLWRDTARQRIVLKSRQMGVSRALACEAVYVALNRQGSTVLFVSRSLEAARNLLRYAHQSIQPDIKNGTISKPTAKNTTSMEWEDLSSRIVSLAASIDAARSYSATDVYLDEAAYLPWAEEIYQSLAPTVSSGGRMTVVSTPHGRGNLFHRLWLEAETEGAAAGWSVHRIRWEQRSEYTPEWAEKERQRHTIRSWAEEYDLSFEASGNNVFRETNIQAILRSGPLRIQPPFFAGVDLARTADYTVIVILDVEGQLAAMDRFNQAEWSIQVDRVARLLESHPGCRAVIDGSGIGDPLFNLIRDRTSRGPLANTPERIRLTPFLYTSESRPRLMEELVLAVEQAQISIVEGPETAALLGEMRSFQWLNTPGGRATARHPPGGHDDCVQALALAWRSLCETLRHPPRTTPALVTVSRAGRRRYGVAED